MEIDSQLQEFVSTSFATISPEAAEFRPAIGSLSRALDSALNAHERDSTRKEASAEAVKLFVSASVEVWKRGVHSFLVSASLTDVSPMWSSVSGYYSSHYSIRAIAHLLGFFQMYYRKRIVHVQLSEDRYEYRFDRKHAQDREHRVYWKIVKADKHFAGDPFFRENYSGDDESDGAHRDRANYHDHLPEFPTFHPLDAASTKNRVNKISEMEIDAPPIPRVSKYPDVESVQIVAYHRLVRYRDIVDAILGDANAFWNSNRQPSWASEFIDFQITEADALRIRYTL